MLITLTSPNPNNRQLYIGETAAILGAAAISAAATGGSAIAAGKLNKKNRAWQEKMYSRQQDDNLENWNRQNAYNIQMYNDYQSPAAIKRQLEEAGLNPYLMYSQGAAGLKDAPSAQQQHASSFGNPQTSTPDLSNIGSSFQTAMAQMMQLRVNNAAIANTKANTDYTNNKSVSEVSNNLNTLMELELKRQEYEQRSKSNPLTLKILDGQIRKLRADIYKISSDIDLNRNTMQTNDARIQLEEMKIAIDKRYKEESIKVQKRQVSVSEILAQAEVKLKAAQTDNVIQSTAESKAREKLVYSQERHENVRQQHTWQLMENLRSELYKIEQAADLTRMQKIEIQKKIDLMNAQELKGWLEAGGSLLQLLSTPKK